MPPERNPSLRKSEIIPDMDAKRSGRSFANGVPELLILKLVSRGEMYGYQLVKAIKEDSGGKFSFAEGHIYPLLHAMEANGYLTSRRKEINNKVRLYYHITPKGRKKLGSMMEDWLKVKAGLDALLRPTAA